MGTKPEPWAAYTTPEFWDDPHISEQMLNAHLSPDWDAASRNHEFIDRSVVWLINAMELVPGDSVLDLGCGPGLYANRIAAHGINVTGVDISTRAIAFAEQTASKEHLPARFIRGDYLVDSYEPPTGGYTAAILIYEDYCALSPNQREVLLARIHSALEPDGRLLLDVTAAPRFAEFAETSKTVPNLMGGFWSAAPYTGTKETWTYPALKLILERYFIKDDGGTTTRVFWNWMQCLTLELLMKELADTGFHNIEIFGDVAGDDYHPANSTIAALARK